MNLFKYEFKKLFKPMIIWTVVCVVCIVLFMSFYPMMEDSGMQEFVGDKLEVMPEAMKEAFNLSGTVDFSKLSDYTLYVIQYIAMASGIYGAILGVSSLVKEESEGTIEFLYSKPIKRSSIVTAKLLASSLIFFIFILLLEVSNLIVSYIIRPENISFVDVFKDLKVLYIGILFLGSIFISIGFLISVFIKSAKKAVPIALAIFFITYVFGILGDLKKELSGFLYLSPFNYAFPGDILKSGFQLRYVLTGFIIIFISIVSTYFIYNKKDFA